MIKLEPFEKELSCHFCGKSSGYRIEFERHKCGCTDLIICKDCFEKLKKEFQGLDIR